MRAYLQSAILLLCLLAFALRLGPAFDNRFHPDEALFSSWALKIASGENVLLSGVPVDKPPLLIYTTAISFFFFGQTEIAARLPNLAASVISVALIYWLAVGQAGSGQLAEGGQLAASRDNQLPNTCTCVRCKCQLINQMTVLPSLLLTFSPFAILFAPTAFLDPAMVMFGLASLVAASRGQAGWAGMLLGLSFATKVQGLFFAPLILIYWSTSQPVNQGSGIAERSSGHRVIGSSSLRLAISFLVVALAVLAWDRLRGGLPFWEQQAINYGGIRVIYPSEVGPRLNGWLALLPYFFGSVMGLIGLIGLPIMVWFDLTRNARARAAWIDLALIAWLFVLFALHWLLAFPVWDRYFLILVPIAALLVSRVIGHLANRLTGYLVILSLCFIVVSLLPFSLIAAGSGYPIGGDHGGYDGIDQVAGYLRTLPSATVVYDHWLGWELDYYLGEGHVFVAYFDTPAALADDLRAFGRNSDRYVVFPANESPDKAIEAIGPAGFVMSPIFSTQNRFNQTAFTIFKIQAR